MILLSVVANFFCFSQVVGVGATDAIAAGSEVYQIVGICATIFVVSAILIYAISVFGMRERTFEEALEQQRIQGGTPLLAQPSRKTSRGAAGKPEKKKPKKKAPVSKSSKEIHSPAAAAVPEKEIENEETEVAPPLPPLPKEEEVVVTAAATATATAPAPNESKSAKKRRNKRKESSSVEEEIVVADNQVENALDSSSTDVAEADSGVELEKVDGIEPAIEPEVLITSAEVELTAAVVEAVVDAQADAVMPSTEAASDEAKDRRKKKKKALAAEEEVPPLSDAELVVQLKQLLEEKEKTLKETKISLGSLQTRLGENRGWLKTERAKAGELEAQLADVTHLKQIECQSLNQQLQQKQRDFQAERVSHQSQISTLQDKMQEAGAEAHGRLQHLQNEAKSWRETADRQRKEFEARNQQLEEEKQRMKKAATEETRNNFGHQLQELREKLQHSENRCSAVSKELSDAQRHNIDRAGELENAVGLRETQISQLNSQLTEAENSRNAMDTQLKILESRLQETMAQHKEAQSKLMIAEESLVELRAGVDSTGSVAENAASGAESAELRSAIAAKDAQISTMQKELESIKLEVLNLVNQEKTKTEEAKVVKEKLESEVAKYETDLGAATSRLEREEATKKELEGRIGELTSQLSTKVDPDQEQGRIVEALREIQSTTALNISKEESTESVDAMVEALKSSFALHLLPACLTSDAETFFTRHLSDAFNKLVDKQIKTQENDYATQVQALQDALNVKIEDPDEDVKEDRRGEEICKLRADLEKSESVSADFENELAERQAELDSKAAIVLGLESTVAETKDQLIQLQNSLAQEAESAAKLRDLVAAKEAEIVDVNRLLAASKEELSTSVEKAIDAAVAKSTVVFDEEKRKLEEDAKAKENKYDAILKQTENMLSKLQASVENEEKKWTVKLKAKEDEMAKWVAEKEGEEKLSKEVQDAFRAELEAKVASLKEEKGEWEAEKREIHSRLAAAEDRLDKEQRSSKSAAVSIEEEKASLEAELKAQKESKEELGRRLAAADSAAEASKAELESLEAKLASTSEVLDKASKDAADASSQRKAFEAEAAAMKREVETLKSQLVALTTTPSKKDKKDKKSRDEPANAAKNGDVGEGDLSGAGSNGATGDNVSIGGVSIGAVSVGEEEKKKKKGKSLSKLFSPKSKS